MRNAAVVALRAALALVVAGFAWRAEREPLSAVLTLFALWTAADGGCLLGWVLPGSRRGERCGAIVLAGATGVAAAAKAASASGVTVVGLVWLAACWALAVGVATLGAAALLPGRGRIVLAVVGAVSLAWGLLLLLWPVPGPATLARWLAVLAIGSGLANAALAWRILPQRRAGWDGI